MNRSQLIQQIKEKKSFLCVGLDTELKKIPKYLLNYDDPIFEFNKRIINFTLPYAIAYKPNIAFYECMGVDGWKTFQKTVAYLKDKNVLIIGDAKRADIGNTSNAYAQTFFETYNLDAVTVSPYMGKDSVAPFLTYPNKWTILLALTSNDGSSDFQNLVLKENNRKLYEQVIERSSSWGTIDNTMYVVGATKAVYLQNVRKIIPDHFLLVPGVGIQGGNLKEVCRYGLNSSVGLIVNSSRKIIYAGEEKNFEEASKKEASDIQSQMKSILKEKNMI